MNELQPSNERVRLRWFAAGADIAGGARDESLVWRVDADGREVVMDWPDTLTGDYPNDEIAVEAQREWRGHEILRSPSAASLDQVHGAIIVLMDRRPAFDEEFQAWYNTEHVPQLLPVPGIIQARRYANPEQPDSHLALYLCTSTDVLTSEEWKTAAARTPWTTRMVTVGIERLEGLVPATLVSGKLNESTWGDKA